MKLTFVMTHLERERAKGAFTRALDVDILGDSAGRGVTDGRWTMTHCTTDLVKIQRVWW